MEHLEFCLNEKQEMLVALQLEFEQHKQEARARQAELQSMQNDMGLREEIQNHLNEINLALERRLGLQEAALQSLQAEMDSYK